MTRVRDVWAGGAPHFSAPFVVRPVATTLITLGLALAGVLAYFQLPVAPLPQVEFPTISVQANLPGASPETMASTVATPLERALGTIAGVNELTSYSSLGSTRVTLQFDLSRDINGAARDVQAAINASRALLPTGMPSNPSYRKVNPADAPILILALTSKNLSRGQLYDVASTLLSQRLSQVEGVGQVTIGGGHRRAHIFQRQALAGEFGWVDFDAHRRQGPATDRDLPDPFDLRQTLGQQGRGHVIQLTA